MNELKDEILAYFQEQDAPLSIEELSNQFPDYGVEELEEVLDEMWEDDLICKLESFCSILYALED